MTRNFHFVIVDVRFLAPQSNGLRVGDEMNFVSALSQLQAQFRGDDSAAAVRRITGDSDLHVREAAFSLLCHSMAGTFSSCRIYTSGSQATARWSFIWDLWGRATCPDRAGRGEPGSAFWILQPIP